MIEVNLELKLIVKLNFLYFNNKIDMIFYLLYVKIGIGILLMV